MRIRSFGTSIDDRTTKTRFHLKVAEQLAHKDIVDLAISARRLTEAAAIYDLCKKYSVAYQVPRRNPDNSLTFISALKSISLWDLYGRVIHSTRYVIYSNEFDIKLHFGLLGKDHVDNYKAALSAREFRPVCELSTDRVPVLIFGLEELATVSLDFLESAADLLVDDISLGTYAEY